MAKLGISTGITPNDGLGDTLLAGAVKINSNFNEIYSVVGNGTTLGLSNLSTLNVSGVSTHTGISTFQSTLFGTQASFSGVVTSTTFNGQVNSGVSTLGNASVTQINVTGVSTFTGIATHNATLFANQVSTLGVTTVGLGTTSTPQINYQLSFELTSATNLRLKVRSSDGVLRSANITLA